MDAIEQAIRNAFAKGDPGDAAFREKVYRSAYAALERALQGNPNLAPDAGERRRQSVMAAIGAIEAEYAASTRQAPPVVAAQPAAPQPAAPSRGEGARVEPGFDGGSLLDSPSSRGRDAPAVALDEWSSDDRGRATALAGSPLSGPELDDARLAGAPPAEPAPIAREQRRRPWGLLFGLVFLLVVVVLGVWTASELGLLGGSSGGTQGGGQTASGSGAQGAPRKPGEAESLEDWTTVFTPTDPATAVAGAGARAETIEDSGVAVMRIAAGASAAPVSFDVGQGILERLAGKRAVFDIVAKAADGEAQMSVSCDFGPLGGCGRNRYSLGPERAEYLFEVDVPSGSPTGAGSISIVSDVANGGRAADIFEIRVTVVEAASK